MKKIEVSAAVIVKDNKIFITQRGYGEFKDKWEFPGGKINLGEAKEEALIREIKEELNASIKIKKFIKTIEYAYPNFYLIMHCFLCELIGDYKLLEHESAKFVDKENLEKIDLLPPDKILIKFLKY